MGNVGRKQSTRSYIACYIIRYTFDNAFRDMSISYPCVPVKQLIVLVTASRATVEAVDKIYRTNKFERKITGKNETDGLVWEHTSRGCSRCNRIIYKHLFQA